MSTEKTPPPANAAIQPDQAVFRSFVLDAGVVAVDAVDPGVQVDSVATDQPPPAADAPQVEPPAATPDS